MGTLWQLFVPLLRILRILTDLTKKATTSAKNAIRTAIQKRYQHCNPETLSEPQQRFRAATTLQSRNL